MAGYGHIVFATDLTEAADKAGARAVALSACGQGRLTLLHVVEYFPEDMPVDEIPPEDVDPELYFRARAEARLAALARRLGCEKAEKRVVMSRHAARQGILDYLRQERPDLVVVGALGHPGKLGTTAGGVASDAPCDVLIVQGGRWQPG